MTDLSVLSAKPNRDQSLLKLIAILTMAIDHTGVIFFPGTLWLRLIGRIAFPLFCWGIVIGSEKTRNWKRYALRLIILAFISQPFYMLALNHTLTQFSVMATLFLGFMAIQGMRLKWHCSHIWAPLVSLLIAASFTMDYGWRGVLLIILMYLAKDSRGGLSALMVSFCLYWGAGGTAIPRPVVSWLTSTPLNTINQGLNELLGLFKLQSLAILALPLMLLQSNSGIRIPKWASYLAYPGHLCLLWLLKSLLTSLNLI